MSTKIPGKRRREKSPASACETDLRMSETETSRPFTDTVILESEEKLTR